MYTIKGEPRWKDPERAAVWHELQALECSSSAAVYSTIAAHMGEDTGDGVAALAEAYRAAGKGHAFRALELRYDARGGMTEAQARAARARL